MRYNYLILILIFIFSGCERDFENYGKDGQKCYFDNTCDIGFVCVNDICVSDSSVDGDMIFEYANENENEYENENKETTEQIDENDFEQYEQEIVDNETTPDPNLVAWWKFDEEAGASTAKDSSGNGHDATIVGDVTSVSGINNGSFNFPGKSNSYVRTDTNAIQGLPEGTLSMWFNLDDLSDGYRLFFLHTSNSRTEHYLSIRLSNDDYKHLKYQVDSVNGEAEIGSTVISPQKWNHVALTWDGSNWKAFVNGVNDLSVSRSETIPSNHNKTAQISGNTVNSNNPFLGSIDEVKIYSKVLSATEIKAEYDALCKNGTYNLDKGANLLWNFDFDDNKTPDGWTLIKKHGGPGIINQRIEAHKTDGSSYLQKEITFGTEIKSVVCEWEGRIASSTWGLGSSLFLYTDDEAINFLRFNFYNDKMQSDNSNLVRVTYKKDKQTSTIVFEKKPEKVTADFYHRLVLTDGMAKFTAYYLDSGNSYFDYDIDLTMLELKNTKHLKWGTHTTTDNDTWADNLLCYWLDYNLLETN